MAIPFLIMKKAGGILFIFLILIFIILPYFASSLPDPSDLDPEKIIGIGPDDVSPSGIRNKAEASAAYLKEEWKKSLARNPIFSFFDSILKKLNFLIYFFIGERYDFFSFKFWSILILWLFFVAGIHDLTYISGRISHSTGFYLGIIITVILVWLGTLNLIFDSFYSFVGGQSLWLMRLVYWIIFYFILFIIAYSIRILKAYVIAKKIYLQNKNSELKRKVFDRFLDDTFK